MNDGVSVPKKSPGSRYESSGKVSLSSESYLEEQDLGRILKDGAFGRYGVYRRDLNQKRQKRQLILYVDPVSHSPSELS
jgi:hypothetical protein